MHLRLCCLPYFCIFLRKHVKNQTAIKIISARFYLLYTVVALTFCLLLNNLYLRNGHIVYNSERTIKVRSLDPYSLSREFLVWCLLRDFLLTDRTNLQGNLVNNAVMGVWHECC